MNMTTDISVRTDVYAKEQMEIHVENKIKCLESLIHRPMSERTSIFGDVLF